jgi:hypothetical protein
MNPPARPPDDEKHQRSDHGIRRDSRGEDQPTDKERARQTSQRNEQDGAAQPPSPGQPAGSK